MVLYKTLILPTLFTLIKASSDPYCQAPVPQYVAPDPSNSELIQVISVSRHGDRSPLAVLPYEHTETGVKWDCGLPVTTSVSDTPGYQHEYIHPSGPFARRMWQGNCTDGQLTLKGGMQCYDMGSALRSIYINKMNFLPSEYDSSKLYIESSEFERTRESMMSMMLGFYPVSTRHSEKVKFRIQSGTVSQLYPNDKLCPRISTLWAKNKNQEEWKNRMNELRPILEKVHRIGKTANLSTWNSEKSVGNWHDTLRARSCHGLPLPCSNDGAECVTAEEAQKIFDQADYESLHLYDGEEIQKLAIGTFAQRIVDIFNKTILLNKNEFSELKSENSYFKYMHFSAHDSTIVALLAAFDNPIVFPPYASTLIFELWKNPSTNEYNLRMLFNGKPVAFPVWTEPMCPFNMVYDDVYSRLIVKDFEKECFDH